MENRTNDPRHIRICDYAYPLPDERIARFPLPERDQAKLLVYRHGDVSENVFASIADYLPQGDLVVMNNTRVIPARLHFRKETGAAVEVFCLEPLDPADYAGALAQTGRCAWLCLVGNLKKWKEGTLNRTIEADGRTLTLTARRGPAVGASHRIDFEWDDPTLSFGALLQQAGELPIPPYLGRATTDLDRRTYQTVYGTVEGSVAAPTAGLHFTPRVLQSLDERGIERAELTLHVGAGTFRPVKCEEVGDHPMHTEWVEVSRSTLQRLMAHGGQCTAVGTTSVRTLESLYHLGVMLNDQPASDPADLHVDQWQPYERPSALTALEALEAVDRYLDRHDLDRLHAHTRILIAPGYTYRIVRRIITNFHQPQSTLLLLVSAFIGDDWHTVYRYALDHDFRFLSYGDSSLLIP
ncbi:MAG: S-adenosylmethionine:tRNA ribosyltransferase-isomerase [Bacteroidaceae bacterium]